MGFEALKLKCSYDSGQDDLLNDFYIPLLKESVEYYRIAGYFNSKSLSISARGIEGLIKNNGKMNMIVSPNLSNDDVYLINNLNEKMEDYLNDTLNKSLDEIIENFEKDNLYALGWMLANKKLQIKIAIVFNYDGNILCNDELDKSGLFHQKIGFMVDKNKNIVSFSGSVNETYSGWKSNIEEIKVFKGWEPIEDKYCSSDIEKFFSYWNNDNVKVKTYSMPDDVSNRIIEHYKKNYKELSNNLIKEINDCHVVDKKNKIKLFEYQEEAIDNWIKNNYIGLFEMATGTGKTFTAIGCIEKIISYKKNKPIFVVIASPQNSLSLQWLREVEKFNFNTYNYVIADSTNNRWKKDMSSMLMDFSIMDSYNLGVVFTTHKTLASHSFNEIINKFMKNMDSFIIIDEVHGIGSDKLSYGLNSLFNKRLGLSATPYRWFDDIGTNKIFEYFKNIVYEFTIEQALTKINPLTNKTYLVPYYYYPIFVSLTEDELFNYRKVSNSIIKHMSKQDNSYTEKLQNLFFRRANIIKNAELKFNALNEILEELPNKKDIIVFCSDKQISKVTDTLNKYGIANHKFTKEQGTNKEVRYNNLSEREYIINKFKQRELNALVAIKCLDEGIDIPTASTAILMSNSSNPREYIQRIGRVIRQSNDKKDASIYDIIVVPDYSKLNNEMINLEKKILKKELLRVMDISKYALNNTEVLNKILQYL